MANEPVSPDKIKSIVQSYAGKDFPTDFDPKKWGAMVGWLNKYLVTDDLRRLVLGWLFAFPGEEFKPISSSTLTPQQKNGISKWIGTWFNEDDQEWLTRDTFPQECINVLNAARYDYYEQEGQFTMDLPFEIEGEPQGIIVEAMDDPLWDPEGYDTPLPEYSNIESAPLPPKINKKESKVTGVAV